jgi:hypothetical protein
MTRDLFGHDGERRKAEVYQMIDAQRHDVFRYFSSIEAGG